MKNILIELDIEIYKEIRALTKIQIQLTIFIFSIEILICFCQVFNYILSNFIEIVRKVIESNLHLTRNFFIAVKVDIINFNRFIIAMICVYKYFNFNFLTACFLFEIF